MSRNSINKIDQIFTGLHLYNCNIYTREIFLYGLDEDEIDYKTAITFIKNLNLLNQQNQDAITIHLLSAGGEWFHCMSVYDAISRSKSHITIIGYSCIASMASIILQAGDTRQLTKNSCMMIHYGETNANNHAAAVKSWIDFYQTQNKVMFDIYTQRCQNGVYFKDKNMGIIKIENFIKKKLANQVDWYITPEDAVNYGLADEIV